MEEDNMVDWSGWATYNIQADREYIIRGTWESPYVAEGPCEDWYADLDEQFVWVEGDFCPLEYPVEFFWDAEEPDDIECDTSYWEGERRCPI
jgi:hypothetical protein